MSGQTTLIVLILTASALGVRGADWLDYIPDELVRDNYFHILVEILRDEPSQSVEPDEIRQIFVRNNLRHPGAHSAVYALLGPEVEFDKYWSYVRLYVEFYVFIKKLHSELTNDVTSDRLM